MDTSKESKEPLVLGEHLRKARRNGLTNAMLSRKTGIPQSVLCEWSGGRTPRDPRAVRRLARILGLSMEELLFGRRENPSTDSALVAEKHNQEISGVLELEIRVIGMKSYSSSSES